MNKYTIYCTEEQTKKALELGAPIEMDSHSHGMPCIQDKTNFFICPTAEQMIGWMEDKILKEIHVQRLLNGMWSFFFVNENEDFVIKEQSEFNSRQEATLAAIDAALDYLIYKQ